MASSGCQIQKEEAEIIPVEPEQDNTCVREGETPLLFLQFFLFPLFKSKNKQMKQILGTILTLLAITANAQYVLKGKVTSKSSKNPVEGAAVTLTFSKNELANQVTNADGYYEIKNIRHKGSYSLNVRHVGSKTQTLTVNISEAVTVFNVELDDADYFLEPLEVKSIRAGERSPFAKTTITKEQIEKINLGQDIPFLLNQTPSVVVNSDAGNGVGYTGIRIRGSDATRINMTINGIPYNDAESQGLFFVNLPDISSSVNSFQVQRGVGTSSNGAGAFGATINLSTNEFNEKAYAELNNAYGSFNTWKNTVKFGSGLLNNHFTIDGRLSNITSDGYIDRATSDLKSYYLSAAYISKKSSLRFNTFSGKERTYQAWNGVDAATLLTNRTYNSAGTEKPGEPYENEVDNYTQTHYQLFFNHSINDKWSFNTAAFLTRGKGYYEQYKADMEFSEYGLPDVIIGAATVTETDLVRQLWLDNYFYGQIASLQFKKPNTQFTFGGGWNTYDGMHYGKVIWAEIGIPKDHKWYDLDALKKDANVYAKLQQRVAKNLEAFIDVQYRHVDYTMNGFRDRPALKAERKFDFFNPKLGITYLKNGWMAFASYAIANKEPNRDDFEAGAANQPNSEQLHDIEIGVEKRTAKTFFAANLYYMIYKDQLVLTGKVNDVGAYTRTNVPNSFRRGIELQASQVFTQWLNVAANVALSENKIDEFTEFIDDYDNAVQKTNNYHNTTISFSPAVVGGLTVNILPFYNATLSLQSKYVSRQFLDNTEMEQKSLQPYFLQDARLNWTIPNKFTSKLELIAQVNNIFNKKYEPNGYTFSYIYNGSLATENYYYPMAGTNFMVGVNVKF